ncbi:hypothetical protein BJ165DRAFT_1527082 [Panaeolus papilionaceus]|nr:hypothetical protein BJ165DRAFT_1527082 [Panaeolus papilionaceus]
MTTSRLPYAGIKRQLVVAFDVGTTFSGISYAILEPGCIPEIRGVTQFPGQENVGGDCKIPTVLYYDASGRLRAAGAEAKNEGIEERAADEGWVKAEWFKLHMRPNPRNTAHFTGRIPPLPPGKTAVTLYADFLRYLHKCVQDYIEERHSNGRDIWRTLHDGAHYVITHPNGWEGGQQNHLRRAAMRAGLFRDSSASHARLSFLTEGEASLHFCVRSELTTEAIRGGKGILVVDAGGGTIDISAYKYVRGSGYEETAVPRCYLQGSITVTTRAEEFLKAYLRDSRFSEDTKHIAESFDKTTKHVFRDIEDWQYIKFGSPHDRDDDLNIRRGQLKLTGARVAGFFKPSVDCIIESIAEQRRRADIQSIFLVEGIDISRPDPNRVNKAVADGAVSFYLDHLVTARMTKFDYGVETLAHFDLRNPHHLSRADGVVVDSIGRPRLPGSFSTILSKNVLVTEAQQFIEHYHHDSLYKESLRRIKVPITSYRGNIRNIGWLDEDPAMFHTLCYVSADTTAMSRTLTAKNYITPYGATVPYYELCFEIVLTVGKTELTAHVAWMEEVRPVHALLARLAPYFTPLNALIAQSQGVCKTSVV